MNEARENLTAEEIEAIEDRAWEEYWNAVDEAESEIAFRELQAEALTTDYSDSEIPW